MRIDREFFPWVAGLFSIILYYPWCYQALSTITCKNNGKLDLWRLKCDCPFVFSGSLDCSECLIHPDHGSCGYSGSARFGIAGICKGNWVGELCDECHNAYLTVNASGFKVGCSGPCRNDLGFYEDVHGRCTVLCSRQHRCNGHGTCTPPHGHCQCDQGYSSVFSYSVSQYGSECAQECPNRCEVNGVVRGRCNLGSCVCEEGYTGVGCQKKCPKTANGICNGHGYCDFDAKCQCDSDQYGLILYTGSQCQFKCPVSKENGLPCGSKQARCVPGSSAALDFGGRFSDGDAICICPSSVSDAPAVAVPHVCNCNCNGHGQCARNGCVCSPGWDPSTNCATCKQNYYTFGTNCATFCENSVTCNGNGKCGISLTGEAVCMGCPRMVGSIQPFFTFTNIITVSPGSSTYTQKLVIPFKGVEGETMIVQIRESADPLTTTDECILPFVNATVGAGSPCSVPNSICGNTELGRLCCVDNVWKNGNCVITAKPPAVTACEPVGSKCTTPRQECDPIDGVQACCFDGFWRRGECQYDITQQPWEDFTASTNSIDFSRVQTFTYEIPSFVLIPYESYPLFMATVVDWRGTWTSQTTPDELKQSCAKQVECKGFTTLNDPPWAGMITCISESLFGCGKEAVQIGVFAGPEVYEKTTTKTLDNSKRYQARGASVQNRGCTKCVENFFPSPADAIGTNVRACSKYCNPSSTCGEFGVCTKMGNCACMNTFAYYSEGVYVTGSNISPASQCQYCKPGFYPDPVNMHKVNFDVPPCSRFCLASETNDRKCNQNESPSGCNHCCKHGYCLTSGLCSCVNEYTMRSTGYFGESCNDICQPSGGSTSAESCSGHGQCRKTIGGLGNDVCECEENYFGLDCQYTASLPEQQYYYYSYRNKKTNALVTRDEYLKNTNENEQIVASLQCNGAPAKLTTRYKIEFKDGQGSVELYNETCTIDNNANIYSDPPGFSCCFGHNNPRYANMTKIEKGQLMEKFCDLESANVFCNVNEIVASDDQVSQMGMCATVVCDCSNRPTTYSHTSSAYEINFAGPGCQLQGCPSMSFQTVIPGTQIVEETSVPCGRYPPESAAGQCIRGQCVPKPEYQSISGMSKTTPTLRRNEYAEGRCQCFEDQNQEEIFGCGYKNFDNPFFTENCCSRGDQPYSGLNCDTYCSCASAVKGSCQTITWQGIEQQGMACYCRMGSNVTIPRQLFCGSSCETQCNGVIDTQTLQPVDVAASAAKYCPDIDKPSLAWKIPADSAKCFEKLAPCNNHGSCANSVTGQCVDGARPGSCECNGHNVPLSAYVPNSLIPGNPSLFTGANCQFKCPRVENAKIDDFYAENWQIIDNLLTFPQAVRAGTAERAQLQRLTLEYYNLYLEEVCNGHGYCDNGNEPASSAECTCFGDFGGPTCSKQCGLEKLHYTYKSKPYTFSQKDIITISQNFGIQPCGPRSRCATVGKGVQCSMQANTVIITDNAANIFEDLRTNISGLTGMSPSAIDDLINWFPTAFITSSGGTDLHAVDCQQHYYTKGTGSLSENGLDNRINSPQLNPILAWQSKRTCDGQCLENTHFSVQNYDGPKCCQKCISDWETQSLNLYGGCEKCKAFATGRECTECKFGFKATCLQNKCSCDDGLSPCSQCSLPNSVYPFDNDETNFPACFPCMSALQNAVCSGNGMCSGAKHTFSEAVFRNGVIIADPIVDLATSEDFFKTYTQCTCNDNFDGVTCALPRDSAGCQNSRSTETASPWCNCYNPDSGLWYGGFFCEGEEVAMQVRPSPTYPTHIINGVAVVCGGNGIVVNENCQCTTGRSVVYDSRVGCMDLVQSEAYQRQWDVCVCAMQGQQQSTSDAVLECSRKLSDVLTQIQTRSCAVAANILGISL